MDIEKGKTSDGVDSRAYRELEELVLSSGQLAMPPESWAHWLAWEFCFANGEHGDWVGRTEAEIQYMRLLAAKSASLPLRQVPSCARWPAEVPLPSTWDVGLVLMKSELREWALKNCRDLLGRLLPDQVRPFEITAGTEYIEAWIIPHWIADAARPLPTFPEKSGPTIARLRKKTLRSDSGHSLPEDLGSEDLALLREIWKELPIVDPLGDDITIAEFSRYQEAFNASAIKPEWEIQPQFHDPEAEIRSKHDIARHRHYQQLSEAVRSGEVRAFTREKIVVHKLQDAALIPVEDARAYLAGLGFELRVVPSPNQAGPAAVPSSAPGASDEIDTSILGATERNKQRDQEEAITEWLTDNGYFPMELPKPPRGKKGVPGLAFDSLKKSDLFKNRNVFDKAWHRLLNELKEIGYAED